MSESNAKKRRLSSTKARRGKANEPLVVEHPDAAGIDIGAREIWVSVRKDRADEYVRSFTTLTPDLLEMALWLKECGVDTVVMESTGVYWVPLHEVLTDHGFDVLLVNAHHVKNVPGRKSDVLDCQWLRRLHSFGLLSGSFRPTTEIVEVRSYLRQRDSLVRQAADQIRRIQKALTLMNVQLHTVISKIMGVTGMKIIRAIVAGETDPVALAAHRNHRIRASVETLQASLTGNYRREHVLALRQALSLYDTYQVLITECDGEVRRALDEINAAITASSPSSSDPPPEPPKTKPKSPKRRPHEPAVDLTDRLVMLTGVDLTTIPGLSDHSVACLISEIGTDMSCWATPKHFTAWLRLCPRTDITGGRAKNRRTLPSTSRANAILRLAAVNAGRTQTDLGASYRRLSVRKEKAKAVVATARKMAVIIYIMLRDRVAYRKTTADDWTEQRRHRETRTVKRRAKALGYELVATALPTAEEAVVS